MGAAAPELRRRCAWLHHGTDPERIGRIQGCGALRVTDGELASEFVVGLCLCRKAHPTRSACRRARDRQGQVAARWACGPSLTVTGTRRPSSKEVGTREMVANWPEQGEMRKGSKSRLDKRCPIQADRPHTRLWRPSRHCRRARLGICRRPLPLPRGAPERKQAAGLLTMLHTRIGRDGPAAHP